MAGIVDMFCKQSAQWRRKIPGSEDKFGEPQYGEPVAIKCRAVKSKKLHRTAIGDVIPTSWNLLCIDPVEVGDIVTVDGEELTIVDIGLTELVWISGKVLGRFCHA